MFRKENKRKEPDRQRIRKPWSGIFEASSNSIGRGTPSICHSHVDPIDAKRGGPQTLDTRLEARNQGTLETKQSVGRAGLSKDTQIQFKSIRVSKKFLPLHQCYLMLGMITGVIFISTIVSWQQPLFSWRPFCTSQPLQTVDLMYKRKHGQTDKIPTCTIRIIACRNEDIFFLFLFILSIEFHQPSCA